MNQNRRITLMVSIGLLISVLIGINAQKTIHELITTNNWLVHTHLVINKTQRVVALLTTIDNDLRGHLLTKNTYFKTDFDRNAHELGEQLKALQALTKDNPVQQERIRTLNTLFHQKLTRSQGLFKGETIETGKARLDSIDRFLAISNQLYQVLKATESYENVLLETRTAQNERSAAYATVSNLIGAISALAMIMWAMYLLFQALRNSKKLNQQLADSEQQTKQLLDAVPVPIIVVDRTGRFYYANGAAFNMLGAVAQFDSYTDTLKSVDFYRYPSGELYPLEQRPTYQALQGKAAQADDLQMYLNGKPVQISSSSSPVYSANGDLQYVVTSIIDITDRVQSQERLREAKEMAETTAKLKENFLANMSHEIRTPLNAMLGFSDLLGTTSLDAEQKEFLGSIQTAGKNLLTIVNDILDISKIEAGMIKLESIPFSIHLLASSIKTMFQATAADKDLKLDVITDSSLPPVLLGDPTRLTQILLNLLSNAIKFTKRGGVTVQISKCEQTAESVRLRFAVVDTGIGIEAHVLPTIFERFQQANDFTTRFYGGTGLGLNIVKSLTELQGGAISVDSTIGVGSKFTVEITYSIGVEEMNSLADQTPANRMVADQPVHVLVAEDNVMNQKLVTQVLKRLGCQVEVADNGEQVIHKLQNNAYDIILMDIQMPIMDGYETTHYIRSKLNNSIPIIAMTAHALASEREECLKAGMDDFLPKPFRMEELQRLLKKYLRSKNSIKETVTQDKSMVQPSATFSSEYLMNSVGNDMELAVEILELYLTQTPIELEKLQQALDQRDIDAVSRLIHMYKAHTRMLGLDEATRLILEAEELVKDGKDTEQVWPLIEQYIQEIKSVLPTISVYLETTAGRTA